MMNSAVYDWSYGVAPPSESVALAVAILKSKPDGMTGRGKRHLKPRNAMPTYADYVLQLRAQSRSERPYSGQLGLSRYLDHAAYWRERCKRAERKCSDLEIDIVKAERLNHALPQPGVKENPKSAAKRKVPCSPSRSSKRIKSQLPQTCSVEETLNEDLDIMEELGSGEYQRLSLVAIFTKQ
jgi:hypothetical protein